jgi:hypothetical protein
MKKTVLTLALMASLASPSLWASNPSPTAIDLARILVEQGGSLDNDAINQIFATGVEANMRIPTEHLAVAFYDRRSGRMLDEREVRELMGVVRQDGAHELLEMASGLGLPMENNQLRQLLDAAFIASMRRPPEHIDIEFYDRRSGPSGRGGGVSGRTPERPEPSLTTREGEIEQELEAAPSTIPPSLQKTPQAWQDKFRELAFDYLPRKDALIVPLIVFGREGDDFAALSQQLIMEMEDEGIHLVSLTDQSRRERDGEWIIVYTLAYVETEDRVMAQEIEQIMAMLWP